MSIANIEQLYIDSFGNVSDKSKKDACHKDIIEKLQKQYIKMKNEMKNMMNKLMSNEITEHEYNLWYQSWESNCCWEIFFDWFVIGKIESGEINQEQYDSWRLSIS